MLWIVSWSKTLTGSGKAENEPGKVRLVCGRRAICPSGELTAAQLQSRALPTDRAAEQTAVGTERMYKGNGQYDGDD